VDTLAPEQSRFGRAAKSLFRAGSRHLPFLILLTVLALHSLRTFGNFLMTDDLRWVARTVADAHRPWNAFGEPLFGNYFRPIPHLVWLLNYYLWGFNFDGHQFMFILMWLAGPALVYAVGCRLRGRTTGLIAAVLVGLNNIYLAMSSWKSWYTTLTEYAAVLLWLWFYLTWLDSRRRRHLVGAVLLGVVGVLSRELAQLIMREATPDGGKGRAALYLLIWAILTAAVIMALPSYRAAVKAILSPETVSAVAPAPWEMKEVSAAYFVDRFTTHTRSIFSSGISAYLLLFAVLFSITRVLRLRERWPGQYRVILLAVFLLLASVLALVMPPPPGRSPESLYEWVVIRHRFGLAGGAGLVILFVLAALTASRWSRILAAWFVVSFLPILFLKHASNAYHTLAFTAMALYVGYALDLFFAEEVMPAPIQNQAKPSAATHKPMMRFVLGALLVILGFAQVVILYGNYHYVEKMIRPRVSQGRIVEAIVSHTVRDVLKNAPPGRRLWVAGEAGRTYGDIAGLILQEKHGFKIERLDEADPLLVGLRDFDTPLRVYTYVIPYDKELFNRHNRMRDPGFEAMGLTASAATTAHSGKYSLALRADGTLERHKTGFGPFTLEPGTCYVFGGFLRREAEGGREIRMSLASLGDGRPLRTTPSVRQRKPQWQLLWDCAVGPPAMARPLEFRVIEVALLKNGAVFADDVFLCPTAPLIAEARRRMRE